MAVNHKYQERNGAWQSLIRFILLATIEVHGVTTHLLKTDHSSTPGNEVHLFNSAE